MSCKTSRQIYNDKLLGEVLSYFNSNEPKAYLSILLQLGISCCQFCFLKCLPVQIGSLFWTPQSGSTKSAPRGVAMWSSCSLGTKPILLTRGVTCAHISHSCGLVQTDTTCKCLILLPRLLQTSVHRGRREQVQRTQRHVHRNQRESRVQHQGQIQISPMPWCFCLGCIGPHLTIHCDPCSRCSARSLRRCRGWRLSRRRSRRTWWTWTWSRPPASPTRSSRRAVDAPARNKQCKLCTYARLTTLISLRSFR